MFRLAYNTNGLAHHRVLDALELLADLGYEGVALTPDAGRLDPDHLDPAEVRAVRARAEELGLALAVETGARFLVDPRRKHHPTLLDGEVRERARRADFLRRSIDLARDLGAGVVSIWSGVSPDGSRARDRGRAVEQRWEHLVAGLVPLLDHAAAAGVRIGFEPEPGMFVERPDEYAELVRRLGARGDELGLTLDVGHLVATDDLPVGRAIRAHGARLVHVHLDDCPRGVHEHRLFGAGDLDLGEALNALLEVGYSGLAAVELSRDSHRGPEAAALAIDALRGALP